MEYLIPFAGGIILILILFHELRFYYREARYYREQSEYYQDRYHAVLIKLANRGRSVDDWTREE